MKLSQIRHFLAVAEAGSINAAARKLGVSQPALSKSLGSLEKELAASLIIRAPTGVTLTASGRAFHVRVRAGYAELAKAQEELACGAQEQVALGFGPFFANRVVPQAVLQWREEFPNVQLRLVEGLRHTTGPMVRDATLDMSLAPRPPKGQEDPAIRFKPIAYLNRIVVARRGHPLAQRAVKPSSAATWERQHWVSNARRAGTAEALRAIGVNETLQITECESYTAMFGLLTGSDLLGIVQHPFLEFPQVRPAVQQITITEQLPGMTVGLHTRADAPLTRPAAALARLLADIGRQVLQRPQANK